ncbi:MAG TPA: OmpA family protein [Nitrospirales bacterium]|jgi:peptidoglycan-associated lipoprotein
MTNSANQTQAAGLTGARINPAGTGLKDQARVTQINMKEVALVVTAILVISGLVGGYVFYTKQPEAGGTVTTNTEMRSVPAQPAPLPVAIAPVSTFVPAPAIKPTDSIHADIYFDFDRSRLRADAVTTLMEKAEILKKEGNWSILVQGHADQYGPVEYNKALALRRGQAVQQFLVELGVPEAAIKVVTIGKDATICEDQGKECQRLNRRVHLEMKNLGSVPVAHAPINTEAEPSTELDSSAVTQ